MKCENMASPPTPAYYVVVCYACRAWGPNRATKKEAVDAWNQNRQGAENEKIGDTTAQTLQITIKHIDDEDKLSIRFTSSANLGLGMIARARHELGYLESKIYEDLKK